MEKAQEGKKPHSEKKTSRAECRNGGAFPNGIL